MPDSRTYWLNIVCVPCEMQGRNFLPSSMLINTPITGHPEPHTVTVTGPFMAARGWSGTIVVDDLAVTRSWMLPELSPSARDRMVGLAISSVTDYVASYFDDLKCMSLSSYLAQLGVAIDEYEKRVVAMAKSVQSSQHETDRPGPLEDAYRRDIMRRKSLLRRQGVGRRAIAREHVLDVQRRAALQVANYAVQGELVAEHGLNYVAMSDDELSLMCASGATFVSARCQAASTQGGGE